MMLLPLEKKDSDCYRNPKIFHWTKCAPFVENKRGKLIHRPRSGATYQLHKSGPHIGITFWCGMAVTDHGVKLTLLDAPPDGKLVCERCEAEAVANGLPSSDELAGRHVHKGRTIAVATCCLLPGVTLVELSKSP